MILSARFLYDVQTVNSWHYVDVAEFTEGDAATISFQLVDLGLDKAIDGFSPAGRRYVPPVGTTLSCVIESIDESRRLTRAASQPYATDGSIWNLTLLTTDTVRGTANLRLTLTEPGGRIISGMVKCGIRAASRVTG